MHYVFDTYDTKTYYYNGEIYMQMPDADVLAYTVFSRMINIKGTFGGTYNGTTSSITFYGDGTGQYVLTGNMETTQSFTYTIVPFVRFEETGVKYQVKAVLEGGMEHSFDVYPENIVNGRIVN